MARTALARGDVGLAGELWGAVCREREGRAGWEERRPAFGGQLVDEDDRRFRDSVERGRELDLWDAVAIALGEER